MEGEGRILGGADVMANPVPVKWGTAPVLIQSTLKPGKIRVTASMLFEGSQKPVSGVLEFSSVAASVPLVYDASEAASISHTTGHALDVSRQSSVNILEEQRRSVENAKRLKEVERQQAEFGEDRK